ncbi:bromodomain-containing protein 3 [Drosophila hydei]|uniref:Bromodomain-containing protein 3 n=1 Tax=Drosophila hydei TaxID=7224 RepID=A0A6J1LPW0_DROHY|nr:bromodomain-containing protein 3 [Drosophila hydei]
MDLGLGAPRKEEMPPRFEPYVQPVNGIVQPPVMPPPGRRGRRTNVLESLKSVLKFLWKSRWSYYFRYPVDAVALCIPDYHNVIRQPMDLTTIRRRLNNNYYWQAAEALDDFELIFENCMLYNLEGTEVHSAGKELRSAFYTRLSFIDLNNETELVPQAAMRKRKAEPAQQIQTIREHVEPAIAKSAKVAKEAVWPMAPVEAAIRYEPQPQAEGKPEWKAEAESERQPEPEPEAEPDPLLDSEPIEFEVNPNITLEWQNYLVEKSHAERLLRCLTKRKRSSINWPFRCCDLWREYGQNLHYDHDAEEKLDWETLRIKLEENQFDNFEEFVETLRTMFQNALTCFPIDETVISAVNEINELLESRLDDLRSSMAEKKTRLRHSVNKSLRSYNLIVSQQESFINSEESFSYGVESHK